MKVVIAVIGGIPKIVIVMEREIKGDIFLMDQRR
jgi:hypothetical protein